MRHDMHLVRAIVRGAFFGAALALCALSPNAHAGPTTLTPADISTSSGPVPRDMIFVVTRTGDVNYDAMFDYRTVDGTAIAGIDYTAASGSIRMPAGTASVAIPVTIAANTSNSASQSFGLVVENSSGLGPSATLQGPSQITTQKCLPFAIGDFVGNGLPDFLGACGATPPNPSYLRIFFNGTLPLAGIRFFDIGPNFYTTQGFGRGLAAADINGDGKLDMIVADVASSQIDVSLNNSSTSDLSTLKVTFAAVQTFSSAPLTFNSNADVAVADLNGDGKPDVIVASDSTAAVFMNTTAAGAGSASFAPVQALASGGFVIRVADINGDGKPDLVIVGPTGSNVLINTTPAAATAASFVTTVLSITSLDAAVADINGDGLPDVIGSDNCGVALNTTPPGASSASFAATQNLCNTPFATTLVVADVNGDGRPDVITGNQDNATLTGVLNTTPAGSMSVRSDPSFTLTATSSGTLANPFPFQMHALDANGDGRPEFVVSVLSANGTEMDNFDNRCTSTASAPALGAAQPFTSGIAPGALISTDVNGDGRPDLIVANNITSVSVLLDNTAPGAAVASYASKQDFNVGDGTSVASADINGDGLPDLIVTDSSNNNVAVLLNTTPPGQTTQSFATAQTFATGMQPLAVAAGDLNGDGRPDLAVANAASGTVSILFNTTASGSATATFATQMAFPSGATPYAIAIADVNHDFVADVIVTNFASENVAVLLNTTVPGAATPVFAAALTFGAGSTPISLLAKDLNGDGFPDLVVANRDGNSITVLQNTSTFNSSTVSFTAATVGVGLAPSSVAAAQLGADGLYSLVVSNAGDNSVSVLVNTTTASQPLSFSVTPPINVGAHPLAVAATDANTDGKTDIAVANRDSNSVSLLLNAMYQTTIGGSPATGTIVHDYIFADGFE